jgi:hypothetical protein
MQRHHHRHSTRPTAADAKPRAGSVLVTVFVIVLLLTLGAYSFTTLMISELRATDAYERDAQSRALADSGIEWVAANLGTLAEEAVPPNLYDNPSLFQGVILRDSSNPRSIGRFSTVAPRENDFMGQTLRFGLTDESSKFNLNALLGFDLEEEQQRDTLLALPNMTIEIADAILDWIDDDQQPRQFGAEDEYYGTLSPPYQAKNAPLESIDELLQVRGLTAALLYGEDANRNGLLDPAENDADVNLPLDDGDGALDRGWSACLTVDSRETNLQPDGSPRINVNDENLAGLYDALVAAFDEDAARFVVAYRLSGSGSGSGGGDSAGEGAGGSRRPTGQSNPSDDEAGVAPSGNQAQVSGDRAQVSGNRAEASGNRVQATSSAAPSGETRGGLDLSDGAQQEVTSLFDLIGATVEAEVNGQEQRLESPWSDDAANLGDVLPKLLDTLTTSADEFVEGRINASQAPREVLLMIPELDEQVVESIIGAQVSAGSAAEVTRTTSAWLLLEGIVDLEQMRTLDPYVTGGGDVYRTQIVGYYDAGGPLTRLEAVIDATQAPPQIVLVRDLTGLGWGYTPQQLNQPAGGF